MIHFERPEAFLLAAVIAGAAWKALVAARPACTALRVVVLLLATGALAGPYAPGAAAGRDLVLVVDRSLSMPEGSLRRVQEITEALTDRRRPGDRVGLVTFARDAAVEVEPREDFVLRPFAKPLDRDATDLAAGIERALALIPPARRGSVLLISDGEHTGPDPAPAARAALRRGVRVDALVLRRPRADDVSVEEVGAPDEVGPGEPFQIAVWVRADRAGDAEVRLFRDGAEVAHGRRRLRAGLQRLLFRDVLAEPGVHRYEVEVRAGADRVPENDRALGVVRVAGPARILCVTPGGRADRLTRSLERAGLEVVVRAPGDAPLQLDALEGFRAVFLENVAADDLPRGGAQALARAVEHLGLGLAMTGGKASFGMGGYHRSPVEAVLPVSMEIRQEQRRFGVAMAIALDRSGSMAARVPSGETKMDLANLGACAAIELLSPIDDVAVLAVDSSPHVVVRRRRVDRPGELLRRVRAIESSGGGIFTYTALRAAAAQLVDAPQTAKHVVLFADAADAEEPGDYRRLVPELVRAGVTVSVIGLGSPQDADAAFLRDVARLGEGRCFFVQDPKDLPRVFAQETIQVARSSTIEEPTPIDVLGGIVAIGALQGLSVPTVGGYSVAYAKPGAQLGMRTRDEQKAPFLAFWQHGLGRTAAFLGEADGEASGGLASWPRYGDFFATLARWLAGTDASHEVFAELRREGHRAVLHVEVEPGKEAALGVVRARVLDPRGRAREVLLRRTGPRRLEAEVALEARGVYRAALDVGGRHVAVPPVALPYSPEFERALDPRRGEKLLQRITRPTGGRVDPPVASLFEGPRDSRGVTPLERWALALALVVLLAEIAVRRLHLGLPALTVPAPLARAWARRRRRRGRAAPTPAEERAPAPGAPREEPAARRRREAELEDALERAKARARRRT